MLRIPGEVLSDYGAFSEPVARCGKTIGGEGWPGFIQNNESHGVPTLLFANSTLGSITHWWIGSRQQSARSRQSVTRKPEIMTIDSRTFTEKQFEIGSNIFVRIKVMEFVPANEAYNDPTRQELDHAVLVELLELP